MHFSILSLQSQIVYGQMSDLPCFTVKAISKETLPGKIQLEKSQLVSKWRQWNSP